MDKLPQALETTFDNSRELGGYTNKNGKTIRSGVLLRTAKLNSAKPEDFRLLSEKYHVSTVIDFRSEKEREENPEPMVTGADSVWIDIIGPGPASDAGKAVSNTGGPIKQIIAMSQSGIDPYHFYIDIMQKEQALKGYRKFFDILLSTPSDRAVLWHCTAGKDRTGLAAVFILAVLDFDEDIMMEDYELTNIYRKDHIERILQKAKEYSDSPELMTSVRSMIGVLPETMEFFLHYCDDNFGSVKNFVKEKIGLTENEIDCLQQKYLY